jgi:hypothetical protein
LLFSEGLARVDLSPLASLNLGEVRGVDAGRREQPLEDPLAINGVVPFSLCGGVPRR